MDKIAGLEIRNTKDILNKDTRMCHLVYAAGKRGKTTLAASLDEFTRKTLGKPTLFAAVEPADGGGTASVQEFGVDYVMPRDHGEMDKLIAALQADTHYGGVVLDNGSDYVKNMVQPYALKFPSRERQAVREMGVPDRGDYQSMGEFLRQQLIRLINLTKHPDLNIRKHFVMTALLREKTDNEGNVVAIQPDLPGAMSSTATAMFQTVSCVEIKRKVGPDPSNPKVTKAINQRMLVSDGTAVKILGDRFKVFPAEYALTTDDGKYKGYLQIWEELWVPRFLKP